MIATSLEHSAFVPRYGARAGDVTHFLVEHFLLAPSIVGRRPTGTDSSSRDSRGQDVLGFSS